MMNRTHARGDVKKGKEKKGDLRPLTASQDGLERQQQRFSLPLLTQGRLGANCVTF